MSEKDILEQILQKVTGIEERVTHMEERMTHMEENMNARMDSIETKVDELGQHVLNIQLALENEIRFSIRAIADGHLDITRKLDDVLKFKISDERMILRVGYLETKARDNETEWKILRDQITKIRDSIDYAALGR